MNPVVPLLGALSGALLIFFPGWGIKQILAKFGVKWEEGLDSAILTSFGLGVHLNALMFLMCWVFVDPALGRELGIFLVLVNVAIGAAGWLVKRPISESNYALWILIILGVLIGEYAVIQFPNVIDSAQALQVQQYLLGSSGGWTAFPAILSRGYYFLMGGMPVPAQPGFAGLIFIPSLLQLNLPVATVAAGAKIVLLVIAAVASYYAARRFSFTPRALAALLIFASLLFSHFGLYGMLSFGKDSLFAVIMALTAVCAVYEAKLNANESGLFMSSAILLGAVAVPFLLMFWAIYFVASFGKNFWQVVRQAAWCICPLVISVVGVRAIFATPGSHAIGLLPTFITAIVLLIVVSYLARWIGHERRIETPKWWLIVLAVIPAACIIAIAFALPAEAIIVGHGGAEEIPIARVPLDGKMTAWGYFHALSPMNNPWVSTLALLVCAALPIFFKRFRSPFFVALFSFLPATAITALIHLKLNLHILPNFNIWDITRDTVTWYVGAFSAIVAIWGMLAVTEQFSTRYRHVAVPAMSLIFLIGLYGNYKYFHWLISQPVTWTSSGGHLDKSTAIATDYLWRNARGEPAFISQSVFDGYDGVFQVFGPSSMEHFSERSLIVPKNKAAVYFVNGHEARKVVDFARKENAKIDLRGIGEEAYIVNVKFNGISSLSHIGIPKISAGIDGSVYSVEHTQGKTFRWIGASTKLSLSSILSHDEKTCVLIQLVNPWGDKSLSATFSSAHESRTVIVPYDATFVNPFSTELCVPLQEGEAVIDLRSNKPSQRFPNDPREISFGLIWPPAVL
jgi:hypothetical protein